MGNTAEKSNGGGERALTDFPHARGKLSADQRGHLAQVAGCCLRWFVWDPEKGNRDGSAMGKVPLSPHTGRPGKVDDPTTAGTFDEAVKAIPDGGGVGVLVTDAKPGIVFLDFDHVVSDGVLSVMGQEVVEQFKNAYVELSPSGAGLRVLALGTVGTTRQRGGGIELYPAGAKRWLRMTGAIVRGTVGVIAECQPGIDWAVSVLLSENPDKASDQGAGSNVVPMRSSAGSLTVDQVLDRLESYRGDWSKSAVEVEKALKLTAARSPSGKIAEALSLMDSGNDKSEHDFLILCEAFRRGVGTLEDASELLVNLATRKKVTGRKDYPPRTAESAARKVLQELETPGFDRRGFRGWEHLPDSGGGGSGADKTPAPLPDGMAEALTVSGESLVYTKGGKIVPSPGNVKTILTTDPRARGLTAFNESSQDVERTGPWTVFDRLAASKSGPLQSIDISFAQAWLSSAWGLNMRETDVMRGIEMASRAVTYDPLRDSLLKLGAQWDGVHRLRSWLTDFAMIDDTGCAEYVAEVGICFMVAAVARALDPGCELHTVLTVEGEGGGGKSNMFRILSDAVGPDLFTDGVHDVTNAVHVVEATEGKFIVEIAELAGIRRAGIEALKRSISARSDSVRKPYALRPVVVKRRFIYVATTNSDQYLSDPSGAQARRFWPVRSKSTETNPMDREALRAVAQQLWAEAVRLFQAGHATRLIEGSIAYGQWKNERGERQEDLSFDEDINLLMMRIDCHTVKTYRLGPNGTGGITARDVAKEIGLDADKILDGKYTARIAGTLKAKGFKRQPKSNGRIRWRMPPDLYLKASQMRIESDKLT